jgi:hypothetical protein
MKEGGRVYELENRVTVKIVLQYTEYTPEP